MSLVFVTGSGTGVGKTFVTELLLRQLRRAGRVAAGLKPVATGFDPGTPGDSDPARLLRAPGAEPTRERLAAATPWAFRAPLSPDMAAAHERRAVPFEALVEFCRSAERRADATLIEGIGGVMVPLDERRTVLDWIAALEAPVLLVAGSYLGTLSHTLTAAAALATRGCTLAGVVVSESPEQPVPAQETAAVLQRFLAPVPVHVVPRLPSSETPAAPDLLPLVIPYVG